VIALILPSMVDQFGELGTQLRDGVDEATQVLADPPFNLSKTEIDDRVSKGLDSLRENSGTIGSGVVSGAVVLGELVTGLILTLLLTFFFLKDGGRMWAWVASLAGERRSGAVQEIARRSFTALAGYVRGIATVGAVDAVLVGIALLIIGVPLVVPLMILTFIGAFLPLVGAFTAGLAAVLIALVSNGLVPALIVLAVYIAVQQLEGHLLYPILMSRAVNLHPAVIIVALAAGGILAGIIGIFLAVPVASVIAVTLDYARDEPPPESPLTYPEEGPDPPRDGGGQAGEGGVRGPREEGGDHGRGESGRLGGGAGSPRGPEGPRSGRSGGGGEHRTHHALLLLGRDPHPLDGLSEQARDVHLGVAEPAADLRLGVVAVEVEGHDLAISVVQGGQQRVEGGSLEGPAHLVVGTDERVEQRATVVGVPAFALMVERIRAHGLVRLTRLEDLLHADPDVLGDRGGPGGLAGGGEQLGARALDAQRHLLQVSRDPHGPAAVAEVALDRARDAGNRIGGEGGAARRVEAVHGPHQRHARDLLEILERLGAAAVATREAAGERQEALDDHVALEAAAGLLVLAKQLLLRVMSCGHGTSTGDFLWEGVRHPGSRGSVCT